MAEAGPSVTGEEQVGGQEDTQSENTCPLGHTRPEETLSEEDATVVAFFCWAFGETHQNLFICCRTAEASRPPRYDDVLLRAFSGIAGQGVAHGHVPLLGWQAAVQVEARVHVCLRVQLEETTEQRLKCQTVCNRLNSSCC